jgi:hypothetical protein
LEAICIPNLGTFGVSVYPAEISPTLKVAEEYYTKNGLPIDEDPEWIRWIGGDILRRYDIENNQPERDFVIVQQRRIVD